MCHVGVYRVGEFKKVGRITDAGDGLVYFINKEREKQGKLPLLIGKEDVQLIVISQEKDEKR